MHQRPHFNKCERCNGEQLQLVSDGTDKQMSSSEHFICRALASAYSEFQSHFRFPIAAAASEKILHLTEAALEDSIQVAPLSMLTACLKEYPIALYKFKIPL